MGVLREAHARLEQRMEEERDRLPAHHQAMLNKELAVVKGQTAALERDRLALEADRARMWDEMEAWRVRLEAEERAAKNKVRHATHHILYPGHT